MNPKEQVQWMIARISTKQHGIVPEMLAKVLVEMENKIDKKIEMGPRMEMASPMTASGCSTPNYSTGTLQDPYLTALDDVENSFEKGTMSILVKVLDNLRKNHKGE